MVSGADGPGPIEIPNVYAKQELLIRKDNVCTVEDSDVRPHLKAIPIPQVRAEEVMLLIGQDCSDAISSLQVFLKK